MCGGAPSMPEMPKPAPPPPAPPPPAPPPPPMVTPEPAAPPPIPVVKDADAGNVKAKSSKRRMQQQMAQGTGGLAIPLNPTSTTKPAGDKGGGLSIPT